MAIELKSLSGFGHGMMLAVIDGQLVWVSPIVDLPLICTDRTTPIAAAVNIYSDVMPFAFFLREVVVYLTSPTTSGTFEIDVKKNGATVFLTKPTIDAMGKTSVSATVAPVVAANSWAKGDEITVAVTNAADGTAAGLIVHLIGNYVSPSSPDLTVPSNVSGFTATAVSDSQINLAWSAATDNVGVTGYVLQRALDAGFSSGLTTVNLGAVTSYSNTGLSADTQYFYRIKAKDAQSNVSAAYATDDATTEEAAFAPIWNTLDANHEETPANALKVVTVGESDFSQINVLNLDSNGDYVEWTQPQGQWDFYINRVIIGYRNGAGAGAYYETGSMELLQTFTPTAGDVFRVEKAAGNNTKVYRNGVLIATTAYGDQNGWNFKAKSYPTVNLNTVLSKPIIVNT